jgi:benzoate/toluate 1,2-dioxygenase reductase component
MQRYEARIIGHRELGPGAFELGLSRPAGFEFRAGQHLRLFCQGLERDYSMVSAPGDQTLALCVRTVLQGTVSRYLASVPVGTKLSFSGAHGHFTFRPSGRHAVFVATGSGIAPFVSMVRSGVEGFTLLHGARDPQDLHYRDLFAGPAVRFIACLSRGQPAPGGEAEFFPGRVTAFIERHLAPGAYDFYLCGRKEMIRDITLLVDRRFPDSLVFSEIFF